MDFVEGLENFGDGAQRNYVANYATALMVRGIASKWKQPIGYSLTSGTIKFDN